MSVENRFDSEALKWDSKPETVQSSQAFFETLIKRIPTLTKPDANLTFLDLGCGTGLLSQRLAGCESVAKVVGVDTSDGMISMFNAKQDTVPGGQKMKGFVKLLEDPNDPVLEGEKFDFAVVHLALHHIPDMASVVKTLTGTLKPGGKVFLSDFENDGQHALRFHPESKHHDVERHGVTKEEMQSIIQQAGLVDIVVENSFSLDKTVEGKPEPFPFVLGQGTKTS